MPAPERRTRADITAATLIAVVLLGVTAALWWTSDARGSTLRTAANPLPTAVHTAAESVPSALREFWRAPSPATPAPVVFGRAVVTGSAGTVSGRELATGQVRWRYQRDLALCTVGGAFGRAIAVYRNGDYCSEVTSLEPADGSRGPQRTSPLRPSTRLVSGPDHVLATGQRYLEVWRSDLVRTLQYGAVPTPVKPGAQPRTGCRYASVAVARDLVGVIERCPGEPTDRLTVLRAAPEEPNEPNAVYSVLLPGSDASLVALTTERAAVAVPNPARLVVLDDSGDRLAEYLLDIPAADLRGDPSGQVVPVAATASGLFWFTGSATVALDGQLRPQWAVAGTLGPGTLLAGRLLVPVPGGLAVLDPSTGQRQDLIPVDRGSYRGPVRITAAGTKIVEQRGDTLVVLGPRSR